MTQGTLCHMHQPQLRACCPALTLQPKEKTASASASASHVKPRTDSEPCGEGILSSADQLRVDRSSPSPGWPLPSTLSKSFPQTKPHRRLTLEAYWLLVLSSCIPYSFLKISLGLWLSAFWRMKGGESTLSWVMAWGIQAHPLIRASWGVC